MSPAQPLLQHFYHLKDPRVKRTQLHPLENILTIAICAVICSAENWTEIEDFAYAKEDFFSQIIDLSNGILYERIPVYKASVVLTLTSSCSSVSLLQSELRATMRFADLSLIPSTDFMPKILRSRSYRLCLHIRTVIGIRTLSSLGPPEQPFSIHPCIKS